MLNKEKFSLVFQVGESVGSAAKGKRRNRAQLEILAIEDQWIRYCSVRSKRKQPYSLKYRYLEKIIKNFSQIDPASIVKSVNATLKLEGLRPDYTTETYSYSIAKEFLKRAERSPALASESVFISQGESRLPIQAERKIKNFIEGGKVAVLVERAERDRGARNRCVGHYGAQCRACHFDFEKRYGPIGKGFIHVHHHRKQISKTRGRHQIDPIRDLIPVCPNCHAMIHRCGKMLSISELRQILASVLSEQK